MKIKPIHPRRKVNLRLKNALSKYAIPTDKEDPKLPGLFVFCGSRGSGKTYACVAMVVHFEKKGYITRTFLICPTKQANDIFSSNLKTLDDKKDVCDKAAKAAHSLENVLAEVKKDWTQYEDDLLYKKVYTKFGTNSSIVPLKYEKILESRNYAFPTEPQRPSHLLICDDLQGTSLYSNGRDNLMNHVAIKSRHIPLTVCYLVQSWTGLPRVIRLNATQFMIYKTGDKKQLRQIYEHFGTTLDEATFNRVYEHAVIAPFGFLYIDTEPNGEYMRFRVGFYDFIKI
jgi:predicted ATPase